jgi:hypothetical protein
VANSNVEIRHTARDTIGRQRTSTNQFEIAVKNKSRFRRNSDNAVKGGLILNKTKTQRRAGTKELREMPSVKAT